MKRGFTLIELLTVVCIIAILLALLFPILGTVQRNAKETATRSQIKAIETALAAYEFDWGVYPPDGLGGVVKTVNNIQIRSSSALYYFLTTPFRINPTRPGEVYGTKDCGPYIDIPVSCQLYPGAMGPQTTDIMDVFHRPLQYDNIRDNQPSVAGYDPIPLAADAMEIRDKPALVTPDPRYTNTAHNLQGCDIFSLGVGSGQQCTRPVANFRCNWEE